MNLPRNGTGTRGISPGRDPFRPRRTLACTYHCVIDSSSGASQSLVDLLGMLQERGWSTEILCGPHLDFEVARSTLHRLADQQVHLSVRDFTAGPSAFAVAHASFRGIPTALYLPVLPDLPPSFEDGHGFISLLERKLAHFQPDIVLTYGGHWIGRSIISCAKRLHIPVAFWLRNCEYEDPRLFAAVDGAIVPCSFSRQHYARFEDLDCVAIPSPVDNSRACCDSVDGRYVTFINPQPAKGVFIFAAIARALRAARPDIRFLVVEGRAGRDWLARAGADPAVMGNIDVMSNTPDPRTFYSISRMILVPSLWDETFSRIPVEAMRNGIPVLASRRGGLGENLAGAGFLFDVPTRFTQHTADEPGPDVVAPWVKTIVRLWDDPVEYESQRQRCLHAVQPFAPERVGGLHEACLCDLIDRPPRHRMVADGQPVSATIARFIADAAARERTAAMTHDALDELLKPDPAASGNARLAAR